MTDLRARILDRLGQLEALAQAADEGTWHQPREIIDGKTRPTHVIRDDEDDVIAFAYNADRAAHITTWNPQAVLALCAGARQLVELHRPDDIAGVHCETCQVAYQCQTIRTIARMLGIDPDA